MGYHDFAHKVGSSIRSCRGCTKEFDKPFLRKAFIGGKRFSYSKVFHDDNATRVY